MKPSRECEDVIEVIVVSGVCFAFEKVVVVGFVGVSFECRRMDTSVTSPEDGYFCVSLLFK